MTVSSIKYYTGKGISHRHFHDSHQLLFVTGGRASIKINGKEQHLYAGCLAVIGRFERHSVTPESAYFTRYALRLSQTLEISDILYSVFYNRPHGFSNVFDMSECTDEISVIFKELLSESSTKLPMRENMQKLLIDKLLIILYRKYPEVFEYTQDENFEKVAAIQREFEDGFFESFSLDELAEKYNISVSHLSHCFKRITGSSVMGYLLQCRLSAAKKMLTHSRSTVSEIVDACGFSDSSNFSRTFKENTGLTPSDFRKKYSI